jgi:cytochrome c553
MTIRDTTMNSSTLFAGRLVAALLSASALVPFVSAHAADLSGAKEKAEQVCAACHGKEGNAPVDPSYPRLAGQHQDYLRQALLDYRSDSRKNAIMGAQAKALTKKEVGDLAAYYASMPGQLVVRK